MPEFSVGSEPRQEQVSFGDQVRAIVDWFLTPDDTGNLIPPTIAKSVGEEIDDQLNGRADNSFAEKKSIEKAAEKALRSGNLTNVLEKLLFGDSRAGAPDPARRRSTVLVDEQGFPYQLNERGERVEVQMLPMWLADP